jgi:hypothetical protein
MKTTVKLSFRAGSPPIVWGNPNSPRRALCALCHGTLPEAPLMIWKDNGSNASVCDECIGRWMIFEHE